MAGLYLPVRQDAQKPIHLWSVEVHDSGLYYLSYSDTGIARDASGDDPQLGNKRHDLVTAAAQKLADARMIAFDRNTGAFTISDLGRIAAKYYIRYTSIETFNKEFRPKMSEADVLGMLCMSTEVFATGPPFWTSYEASFVQFEQVQVRESEGKELEALMERVPCDVKVSPLYFFQDDP